MLVLTYLARLGQTSWRRGHLQNEKQILRCFASHVHEILLLAVAHTTDITDWDLCAWYVEFGPMSQQPRASLGEAMLETVSYLEIGVMRI
jgi:hypothetical protein